MDPQKHKMKTSSDAAEKITVEKKSFVSKKPINKEHSGNDQVKVKSKKKLLKKVIYIEIDDEITSIYDRLKNIKTPSIYLVVPKRALIFQSIVNLKILKEKISILDKKIYIITNDTTGTHLAQKCGLDVYSSFENGEQPSLIESDFTENPSDITPLKASVNAIDEKVPTRRDDKKWSIVELIRKSQRPGGMQIIESGFKKIISKNKDKTKGVKSKLVLVAPNRQALISLIILTTLILFIISYIALPGATITVSPKQNTLPITQNIVLADSKANQAEIDAHLSPNVIPSYSISKRISKVLTYKATGKEPHGSDATGTVTVINEFPDERALLIKTQFQTKDGLIFRSTRAINVPAAKNGKFGTAHVDVVADKLDPTNQIIGERGNIGPSKFIIPKLSPESQKKLYAESRTAFSGGTTEATTYVTTQDIEAARTKMVADLKAAAEAELEANVRELNESQKTNLALLKGSKAIQINEPQVTIPPHIENKKTEDFEVRGEVIATGVAYSKDDLLTILKGFLTTHHSPEKRLVYIRDDSLSYSINEIDEVNKKIHLAATLEGIEEFNISTDEENKERFVQKIREHVINKNIQDAKAYIQNLREIDKVSINMWPAWSPTLPGIPENIRVEIKRE